MHEPRTVNGRHIVARLEEGERYWTRQAGEDELTTFDRLARRAWRDAYRELLRWIPDAVARAEEEAADIPSVVHLGGGHADGSCGPDPRTCRCECIPCQSEHWPETKAARIAALERAVEVPMAS